MESKLKLSVVIPAYNEAANLKKGVLDEVNEYLKMQSYPYEVLIVDDGSKDDTVSIAKSSVKDFKNFKVIENPHGGKALTVISGMLQVTGDIILFTDMDQATPIDQIEKFLPQFREGVDVVIGSRSGRKGAPLIRQIAAWGFSLLRNIILGLPFTDTQCGFKAFRKECVSVVFPVMQNLWKRRISSGGAVNAGFDVELLFLAKQRGYKIVEIPVIWRYVDSERVQFIKDAFEGIRDMLRVRKNQLTGKYD